MLQGMKTVLALLLVVLALIGITDAGFITWNELNHTLPPCGGAFDCGSVLQSPWAHIGPVPIAAVGVLYYSFVFMLAVLNVLEVSLKRPAKFLGNLLHLSKTNTLRQVSVPDLLILLTSFGFGFSLYLVSIMAFAIGEWCKYCLVSAGTCAAIFLVNSIYASRCVDTSPFLTKRIWFGLTSTVYRFLLKPVFFLFDPERVHNLMVRMGELLGKTGPTRSFTATAFAFRDTRLTVKKDGITFTNPVGLSAGFDYNGDLTQILPAVGFGWHTIGTVTAKAYEGNPKPRLGRFPKSKALLVNKGLKSIGTPALIEKLEKFTFYVPTAISIASTNQHFASDKAQLADITSSFKQFESSSLKHALYELNISCPNTFGGEPYTTPARLELLLHSIDKLKLTRPLYAKMPIDQSAGETLALLKVLADHNVQGVIFGNLTKDKSNPAVHPADRKEWKTRKGNLSGAPTFDRSNKHIRLTKKEFKNRFTIVGTGGIFTGEDTATKLDLGADLVQLITGMIYGGPQTIGKITHYLARTTKFQTN